MNISIGDIVISLLITAVVYLLVPIIIIFSGRQFSQKTLLRITVINGVIVWFLFNFLRAMQGMEFSSNVAPAFLWSTIGYSLLKRKSLFEDTPEESEEYFVNEVKSNSNVSVNESQMSLSFADETPIKRNGQAYEIYGSDISLQRAEGTAEKVVQTKEEKNSYVQSQSCNTEVYSETVRFCSRCGGKIDNDTKICNGCGKQYFRGIKASNMVSLILLFLLLLSVFFNVYLYSMVQELDSSDEVALMQKKITSSEVENADLKEENINLQNQINSLESELELCYTEIRFIDEYIVFVEDDGTDLYHKYQCYKFVGDGFWAFNINAAIENGYSPCPNCCD